MGGKEENILPEAKGLFQALRDMGYENTAAVADLVDNSIDANATNIRIAISDDMQKIFIADDGIGMSDKVLNTAIKLGGKKAHDNSSDLGKYGLGLITASLSMGRVLRVITKNDNKYNTAVLDYDVVCDTNKFIADFHESTKNEVEAFDFRTKNASSGTIIIIDKCDLIQYTKAKDFTDALELHLGQVFRSFLRNNKHIFINDAEIHDNDPLFRDRAIVTKLVDTNVEIRTTSGSKGIMHVLAVKVADQGMKKNRSLHLNIFGQGFYILRNNREIASALEFPEIFKKHNDFNLLRIEVSFNPELDSLMGINIKKHDVTPSKEVINALNEVLSEPIKQLRLEMKEKQRKKEEENPFLNEPVIVEAPANGGTMSEQVGASTVVVDVPEKGEPENAVLELEYQFSSYAGEESGPLFKTSITDNQVMIRYNLRNEFYANNILGGDNNIQTKIALDNVIKSSIQAYAEVASITTLSLFADALAKKF